MKQIFILLIILASCVDVYSQTYPVRKTKTIPATTILKKTDLNAGEKNIAIPKLPDLRITSINVKLYNSELPDNSKKYLEISYTIKNDGTVSLALNTILMSGIIFTDGKQPGPASYAGCGSIATTLSGVMLNPGTEYSGTFRCYPKLANAFYKSYMLSIDSENSITEITETNNSASTSILFQ